MAAADFPAVLFIVCEILRRHHPVFITDQPVAFHHGRIEIRLDLHVLCHSNKGSAAFLNQGLACFINRIDISAVSVPVIRQGFHFVILVISHAEAQAGQADAAFLLFRHQFRQISFTGYPNIQIPVRRQQDPVYAAFTVILRGNFISPENTGAPVRGTMSLQFRDCFHNPRFIRCGHTFQQHPVLACIRHDRYGIFRLQLVQKQQECPLHQIQPVASVHTAGCVNQKNKIVSRAVVMFDLRCLQADQQQFRFFIPGARSDFSGHSERIAVFRLRIIIMEIVHHFLNPDAVRRDSFPVQHLAPEKRIGRSINIRRKSGQR